jgi:hypothetical protein
MQRRSFLKLAAASTSLVVLPVLAKPLNFLLDREAPAGLDKDGKKRLTRAVLSTLNTHFGERPLQFWGRPLSQIDMEKRLSNIVHWVDVSVREHQALYPVDPLWVMGQIMAESLFYEFAISPSLAGGICQFMPSTATKEYQMIVAGSLPEHHRAPYRKPELADALEQYRSRAAERERYRKESAGNAPITLNKALNWMAEGKDGKDLAAKQLAREKRIAEINETVQAARKDYIDYLQANITELGHSDIFKYSDFFRGFDERFTYRKPINAMVHMLANSLRVRNGNILAAAAAYNAGLSRTFSGEVLYTQYGTLPNISETSTYVSRILANYEEIALRFYQG